MGETGGTEREAIWADATQTPLGKEDSLSEKGEEEEDVCLLRARRLRAYLRGVYKLILNYKLISNSYSMAARAPMQETTHVIEQARACTEPLFVTNPCLLQRLL